jgi:interleukin-1 receptor-associated kinase 4
MEPSLEMRKLPSSLTAELVQILELQESWKKLMAIIPKTLLKDNYKCDVDLNNPARYRSEHFHVVEDASMRHKKYCADILLREWGTCGKVRPSLGHLKYLLEKAELFRAADFVAVDVLRQEPPSRPEKGPAAPVLFNSEELKDTEIVRIEKLLDAMDYPSSAIEKITRNNSICTNINYSTKEASKVIPKIIVHESPDVEEPGPPSFSVPIVVQNERVKSEPDMIQFSTSTVAASDTNLPNLSSLLSNETSVVTSEEVTSSNNIPAVVENMSSEQNVDVNRPNLSSLLKESNDSESNFNVPVLSELSTTSSSESSSNYPALSQLIDSSDSKSTSSKSSLPAFGQLVDDSAKISRSCGSPLPNLSLNTPLPHFTYGELEHATDNFDETPLDQKGRFLGAGAFGKVYLAVGLFGKPVAVKKMLLENEEVVRVNDTVTKQFINEVENLSKYKHENLVSLLGYSCDGATYCILYEYVPGGSLKDKLQKHELIWTERLYVAIGTVRAISYLHTAYATPLIHRDIKTANILLDYTKKPKLCDFGLIRRPHTQNTNTATTIVGTSAYMAPEAFRGDISVKLDTFSFGVVLLELLTSLPPYDEHRDGVDLVTHIQDNCQEEIKPLLDTSAGSWTANDINFGQELFEIALECLKEKKERPTITTVSSLLGEVVQRSL